jgi:uncharacterized protein YdeI (YjbR/CyaY-like superfamily)
MNEHKGLIVLTLACEPDWRAWLSAHGGESPGVWLAFAKKGARLTTLAKAEAITIAIAHGWIDGQLDRGDESCWLTRFTPRGPRSKWSQNNRATAARLIEEGRMSAAGLREVARAKTDGRWEAAYAPQSRIAVPDDLAAALSASPAAQAFFATLTGANRYAVLYRIADAKTAKTRAARIAKFVAMLARQEVIHKKEAIRKK